MEKENTSIESKIVVHVEHEYDGLWSVTFELPNGEFIDDLRYYYDTRSNARNADTTHKVGQYGRVL